VCVVCVCVRVHNAGHLNMPVHVKVVVPLMSQMIYLYICFATADVTVPPRRKARTFMLALVGSSFHGSLPSSSSFLGGIDNKFVEKFNDVCCMTAR
jgi:hypothetical protein